MMHAKTTIMTVVTALAVVLGVAYMPELAHGQSHHVAKTKRKTYKPAVLQVVTNFEKADVKVNGIKYPEYPPEGKPRGMVLPAGGPYTVEVTYDGKTKTYRLYLKAHETRLLMVDLSGFQGGGGHPSAPRPHIANLHQPARRDNSDEKSQGRVTVYSKPKGQILIDKRGTGERTPGTVKVEPGRHEVQVRFEGGKDSEKKIIRVRKGSRIKLFFREKK